MFELTIEITFSAAHRICGHPGPCSKLHGHNYRAAIAVTGDELNELDMLIDFSKLKEICAQAIAPLDHSYLNDLDPFTKSNPTAENLAQYIFQEIEKLLGEAEEKVRVSRVTVYESQHSSATYRG